MTSTDNAKLSVQDLEFEYVTKAGDPLLALSGVNLEVKGGEFVTILGPSGCGKSTLLYIIDSLMKPSRGKVLLDGKLVTSPGADRAIVFQTPCLLPWRTVMRNVTYGMELAGAKQSLAEEEAARLIELVGLRGFENYYPSQLSGGMQQRVNLARALAVDPEILLMDEPFGALDAQTREDMQHELLRIWEETRKTVLFVTHDIAEAVYLADRVVLFTPRPGRPHQVFEIDLAKPRTPTVRRTMQFFEYQNNIWSALQSVRPIQSKAP